MMNSEAAISPQLPESMAGISNGMVAYTEHSSIGPGHSIMTLPAWFMFTSSEQTFIFKIIGQA